MNRERRLIAFSLAVFFFKSARNVGKKGLFDKFTAVVTFNLRYKIDYEPEQIHGA